MYKGKQQEKRKYIHRLRAIPLEPSLALLARW
jgi:hypothetical protein